MSAYVVADIEITDPAGFEKYRDGVASLVEQFGGRYLVRGGEHEVREGDWQPKRIVILEFPTMEKAKLFYDGPEYADLKAMCIAATNSNLVVVEGV